jgi:hypothetical protein
MQDQKKRCAGADPKHAEYCGTPRDLTGHTERGEHNGCRDGEKRDSKEQGSLLNMQTAQQAHQPPEGEHRSRRDTSTQTKTLNQDNDAALWRYEAGRTFRTRQSKA